MAGGIRVRRFPVPAWLPGRETLPAIVATYFSLGWLLREVRPDILNMHYLLTTGLGGQWWASRCGVPTVLTLIGMDVYDPIYRPPAALRALMRRAVGRSAAVTCISTFVRDIVERAYPSGGHGRPMVVPHGVDTKEFHPGVCGDGIRERYRVGRKEKLVLTVQRLFPRKGVQHFVKAAAIVRRERPEARFLIVGDGPERAGLEALTREVGLGRVLEFAGRVDSSQLPAVYAASDVFAFHTYHEGLGIVLLEAIASGRPVVTTVAGGTTDIIREGENGLLVPPGDDRALADAVVRLLGNESEARTLAAGGRAIAEREYDWEVVTDRYLEIFQRVVRPAP
jgi:glycosyltransferase involved in cell wall biosynthesis